MTTLYKGDVVKLKGQINKMTVETVGEDSAITYWFDEDDIFHSQGGQLRAGEQVIERGGIKLEALERVSKSSYTKSRSPMPPLARLLSGGPVMTCAEPTTRDEVEMYYWFDKKGVLQGRTFSAWVLEPIDPTKSKINVYG